MSQVNSQGHVRDEAETPIPPESATLFEEYEGIFYMHCPIYRAAHTRHFNQSWALGGWKVALPAQPGGELTYVCSTPATTSTAGPDCMKKTSLDLVKQYSSSKFINNSNLKKDPKARISDNTLYSDS
jgi:hypothetical protein